MVLKTWRVIIILAVIGSVLLWYYLHTRTPGGITAQSDPSDIATPIAALAGAITTLVGAISGAAMKYLDYRTARLSLREKELELRQREQEIDEK